MGNEIMRRLLQQEWADKPWMRSGWKSRTDEVYEKIGMKRPKKPRGPRKPRRARSQEQPPELQLGKARLDAVLWRALAQAKEPQVRLAEDPMGSALWPRLSSEEWRAIQGFVSVAGFFEKKELGLNDIEILPSGPVPEEEIIHEAYKRIGLLKVIVGLARQLRPLGIKVKPKPKNPITDEDENLTTAELEALRAGLEQQLSSCIAPKAPAVSRRRRKATASNG